MNSFGTLFRITTFGESHGVAVGCIIDGCPAGLSLNEADIQVALDKRKPGQSDLTTPRIESDTAQILSGTFNGTTIGSPIAVVVHNKNQRSGDYTSHNKSFRPSHSDYTYFKKYGIDPIPGGGRSSARETIGRVIGGAVAKKWLQSFLPELSVITAVSQVGTITWDDTALGEYSESDIETNAVRCPHTNSAKQMAAQILKAKAAGDSLGGVVSCVVKGVPIGLGEPVFGKINAQLTHGFMTLPAVKGVEIGLGFKAASMHGSAHNDAFVVTDEGISTITNNSGGIQGGITNGENITMRVVFKPTSTILKSQKTVSLTGENTTMENVKGRHDPCVLPRAVPIVEAMAWLTLADMFMQHRARY